MSAEAYPLYWPEARGRRPVDKRVEAKFVVGFARARDEMLHELELLGAKEVIVSTNIPLRRDGLPMAGTAAPKDPAVAVYFARQGKPYVFACDTYRKVEHNVRAIGVTLEALRAIARHGATEMLEQAFTGFQALPAPRQQSHERPWWIVLDVPPVTTLERIRAAYRHLAKERHPDVGGSQESMAELNRAYEVAQAEISR